MSAKDAVLALDLGTGGAKAALVGADCRVLDHEFIPYPTSYPAPGLHEQDPADWWSATLQGLRSLAERNPDRPPAAISLSGQSLALVPVDEDLVPLVERVPIWSDARATRESAEFFGRVDETRWYTRTGNGFPAEFYTVFEYRWLARHAPEVIERTRWILGSKDWINARLTGVVATDPSYASGLGAYDIAKREWALDYLEILGIPEGRLPPIVASHQVIGGLSAEIAQSVGLPAGIPVVSGGVDNSCMSLGAGLTVSGKAYLSLGSSNWLTVAAAAPILDPELRPYAFEHVVPGLVVSAFSTFGGGSSLNWLAQLLEVDAAELLELAEKEPVGARGLICVPTLAGGSVAEGGSDVRGVFVGLDLAHDRGAMARAILEGIGYTLWRTADLLDGSIEIPEEIAAAGGGARSDLLLQILADMLDRRIVRIANDQQAAAIGAAALGFLGIGAWSDFAPLRPAVTATFLPDPERHRRYAEARGRFHVASDASRALARSGG